MRVFSLADLATAIGSAGPLCYGSVVASGLLSRAWNTSVLSNRIGPKSMPYRRANIGDLDLAEIDRDGPIPAFVGRIDEIKLTVRLDTAALAQVAGQVGSTEAVAQAMRAHAPAIHAAAQRLLKGGFWTETGDGIEILVTALDL